jgi:hypothetical protein
LQLAANAHKTINLPLPPVKFPACNNAKGIVSFAMNKRTSFQTSLIGLVALNHAKVRSRTSRIDLGTVLSGAADRFDGDGKNHGGTRLVGIFFLKGLL